jgi:hypothetical protein
MRRTPLERKVPPRAAQRGIKPVSKALKEIVRDVPCLVCGVENCDPAHVISRGHTTVGQEDPRAVIPLCRADHRRFDNGELDLLGRMEPYYCWELGFAVQRAGLIYTLKRVTGEDWVPTNRDALLHALQRVTGERWTPIQEVGW